MRRPLLALLPIVLLAPAAHAEVTRETPIVEETAWTLHQGTWKVGITTSSYGLTDRLQLDSALLLDVLIPNAGLKYKFIDEPNLALSGTVFGGASALTLAAGFGLVYGGARLDASFPLSDRFALNLSGDYQLWYANFLSEQLRSSTQIRSGRASWVHLKAALQFVFRPQHVFFLTVQSPTSWAVAVDRGGSDFDALDFAQATVGYQLSMGAFNVRLDLGVGPSLVGFGPTASLDLYFRL